MKDEDTTFVECFHINKRNIEIYDGFYVIIMRLLWSQGMRNIAFQAFHCTTLMTMCVKTYVVRPLWLLDQRYKLVPRILFLWYHQLYRFVWGIRSAPRDTHWTCHTYLSLQCPNRTSIRPKYGLYNMYDMIQFTHVPMQSEAYTSLSRRQASSPQKSRSDFKVGSDYVDSVPKGTGLRPPFRDPLGSKYDLKESYGTDDRFEVRDRPAEIDLIVITKCNDTYVVQKCDDHTIIEESVDVIKPSPTVVSKIRFLSIEYSHVNMGDKRIELKIPFGMMMVGNQLLSPTFVLRLLEYTMGTSGYHFDLDYTLSLMDSQIRMFEMRSHQFLVLNETSYVIDNIPEQGTEQDTEQGTEQGTEQVQGTEEPNMDSDSVEYFVEELSCTHENDTDADSFVSLTN